MFKNNKNYASLDDDKHTMNAPLMSADFGTGYNMVESSTTIATVAGGENISLPHARHHASPPIYTHMYPHLPVSATTYVDSGTTLITCHACTSLNKIPVSANVIKCGVCSTINYMNATASQPMGSTPTTMSCPTCTSHHNLPPNTPPGSTLQCSICDGVSSEFKIVPATTNTPTNNPIAKVVSTPVGTEPGIKNTAATPDNNQIITCKTCKTKNRIPTGTPSGARLKCGVCSTINNISSASLPTRRAGRSCSVTAKNLQVMCGHCNTLNSIPGSHGGVIPPRIKCGNCHKVNGIPKISGNSITVKY